MQREHITDRAHGIDISHYQETYFFDKTWGQVDFAIAKIGEGYNSPYSASALGDFKDFDAIWNEGVAKLDIRGVYFYQRSGNYGWEMQATGVLEAIEKLSVKPQMIWCDVEKGNNVINKTMLADTLRIMNYWKQNSPYTIGLYANQDVLQNYVIPIGLKYYGAAWVAELKAFPFWLAQYYLTGRSPDKQPKTPTAWSNWDLWQYTDNGDSRKIVDSTYWRHYGSPDLNVYNGSVAEMKTWLKIGTTPNPDPDPQPEPTVSYNAVIDDAIAALEGLKK